MGLTDGCDAKTGNGYLDIVDFILQNCCDVEDNLRQLYRRVAFNIAIGKLNLYCQFFTHYFFLLIHYQKHLVLLLKFSNYQSILIHNYRLLQT